MLIKAQPKTEGFTTEYVVFVNEAESEYLIEGEHPTELPEDFDYGIELDAFGGYYFTSTSGAKYINWSDD